jgi:hypothetical protein
MNLRASIQTTTGSPYQAATWWLWLWGVLAVGLIVAAFFIPFRWWLLPFAVGFGIPETIGNVWPHDGRYPPLTDVIRTFVPRTFCLAALGALLGAAASSWGLFPRTPLWGVALFFGVVGWLTNHFIQRYDEPASD